MKNLKILFAALLLLVLTIQLQAQGLGIRGGLNLQNVTGKDAFGGDLEGSLITGFHVGIIGEAAIAPGFLFQSGLLYSTKGAKFEGDLFNSTQRIGYLDVPLHLVFKPALGNGHFILGFGPYLGIGIKGKVTTEIGGEETDFDIKFDREVDGSDEDNAYIRRFDAGGDLFFGYEFAGGLSFQLNTQLGMLKINPEDDQIVDDDTKWNNVGFGLSAMYRFGPR